MNFSISDLRHDDITGVGRPWSLTTYLTHVQTGLQIQHIIDHRGRELITNPFDFLTDFDRWFEFTRLLAFGCDSCLALVKMGVVKPGDRFYHFVGRNLLETMP